MMEVSPFLKENGPDWSLSPLHLSDRTEETQLQCVGSLQVQQKLQVGFICGTLPVPTDEAMSFRASSSAEAAIIPSINVQSDRVMAPQYRILPNQTDLNRLFLSEVQRDLYLPVASRRAPEGVHELCKTWGINYHTQPLARKCEALAVSGLAGCGDQIDVIAPVEILKKIFKIPYSRARLSIAVHRVGRTLILNTGPDVDEGETVIRTKKNQAKAKEKSLFLKFAMQSVRAEACDCPVSPNIEDQSSTNTSSKISSDVLSKFHDDLLTKQAHLSEWNHTVDDLVKKERSGSTKTLNTGRGHSRQDFEHSDSWSSPGHSTFSGVDSFKKSSIVGEQPKDPHCFPNDSKSHKRPTSEGFLRVLFWQLEDIRMLLGSDLLLFSNEKHLSVSLHLWETERQVTPLMWLDAWLDNVMASVPELAICYHHNGIVQGYELLKTDDIFLLKGLSADGKSFFHPHVVQQNAISVLKFLQENCKQDLGTYWLFKNSGEDLVQLFDLSVLSGDHTATTKEDIKKDSLPSSWSRGNGSCSLPLGILLYRLAHRLSLSQDPLDRCKCANFFKNCLELLGERDHLFVRASAHEHVARLILKCHEELGSLLGPLLLEAKKPDDSIPEQQVLANSASLSQSGVSDTQKLKSCKRDMTSELKFESSNSDTLVMTSCETQDIMAGEGRAQPHNIAGTTMEQACAQSCSLENPVLGAETFPNVQGQLDVHATSPSSNLIVVPSVQARLTAVHHVSQAIKALRWQRQLQDVEGKVWTSESQLLGLNHYVHVVPVCVHGELDLIEYFDIRECEIGPFMDSKLLQLVLLLGESYLALGLAYKADGEVNQALKATELACSVYGSVPQHFCHNARHTPSSQGADWVPVPTSQPPTCRSSAASHTFCQPLSQDSDPGRHALFWSQAWVLVGDTYVDYQKSAAHSLSEKKSKKGEELYMAEEVVKEVKRLRKKLGQGGKGCSFCSLTKCSCENDRVSSNTSASSSSSCGATSSRTRRHSQKLNLPVADKGYTRRAQQEQVAAKISSLLSFDSSKGISDVSKVPSEKKLACGSVSGQKAHDIWKSVELEPGSSQVDAPGDIPNPNHNYTKERKRGDIFSFIKCPKDATREESLLAALDCYDAAVLALTDVSERSEEMKSVMRKKGWTYNEIGRMKLACGYPKAAKVDFENAIDAFRDAKDQTNVVLIYSNMAHGLRAAAESLVSQLDSVKATGLFEHVSKNLFEDAVSWYSEALSVYGMAKSGSKFLSDDLENEKTSLCNEVVTQFAHTYLRLGMLLAREDRNKHSAPKVPPESSISEDTTSQAMKFVGICTTANDAIREAIALYESLGSIRAQELAFAQYQLACHHKACCLATVKLEGRRPNNASLLQQAKRYLSLADRYWLKALRFYRSCTHPDMFLEILMERSDLNVAVASVSNSSQLLEVALSHLLEAKHLQLSQGIGSIESGQQYIKLSKAVYMKFVQRLQNLLKTMLATLHSSQNTSSRKSSKIQPKNPKSMEIDQKHEVHRLDAVKLKEMYRLALKSAEMLDLRRMYDISMS